MDKKTAAASAVRAACRVTRRVQERLEQVREVTKDDRSPVTVADFAAQALITLFLAEQSGPVTMVGEESGELLRIEAGAAVLAQVVAAVAEERPGTTAVEVLTALDQGGHDGTAPGYWVLDPVDGTKGFLRGQQYAIALAWVAGGKVTLGVMGGPNLPTDQSAPLDGSVRSGSIYVAEHGKGTWEHDLTHEGAEPVRVVCPPWKEGEPLRACESVESAHSDQERTGKLLRALGCAAAPVRLDSQCKYAVVARGQANAYLRLPIGTGYVEKVWDHAAGSLIAHEAGAVVTDLAGGELDFSLGRHLKTNRGVICAAAGLHQRLLAALGEL